MQNFIILLLLSFFSTTLFANSSQTAYYLQTDSSTDYKKIIDNSQNFIDDDSLYLIEAIIPNSILWVKNPQFDHPQFSSNTTTRYTNNNSKYYRIQNPSLTLLINLESFSKSDTKKNLIIWISSNAFYYGVVLILLIYIFIFRFIFRHKGFIYYIYFHLFMIILLMDMDGWLQKIIWFEYPLTSYISTPLLMIISISLMALFTRKLLSTKINTKIIDTIILSLVTLNIISPILFFFQPLDITLELITALSLLTTITLLIGTIFTLISNKSDIQRYYLLAWMALTISMILEYFVYLGYLAPSLYINIILKFVLFLELITISIMTIEEYISDIEVKNSEIINLMQENEYQLSQKKFDTKQLQKKQDLLNKLAGTDSLTGLYNRREFFNISESLIFRAKNNFEPYSLLMLDLDHFKNVNDTYGHDIGDLVLKKVTHAISEMKREDDIFGRIGGEEFAIFLPNTQSKEAEDIANKFCKIVRELPIDTGKKIIQITVSIGIASDSNREFTLSELMKSSDLALYEAKHNGRDRVIMVEGLPR